VATITISDLFSPAAIVFLLSISSSSNCTSCAVHSGGMKGRIL
jgi:hypothetical protein